MTREDGLTSEVEQEGSWLLQESRNRVLWGQSHTGLLLPWEREWSEPLLPAQRSGGKRPMGCPGY